ncbi:MAG: 50S ribosomal protein L29 [Candidatus Omnitrophica bacterium]|nr:50S ribosomal protein L29 [Candidatus Omnitrophota bacterium]
MKIKDLRQLSIQELTTKLEETRKRLMELGFQKKIAHVEKPHLFVQLRKDAARILTLLKEKKNEGS